MEEYRIIKALSGFYYVQTEDGVVECRARGRFRRQDQSPLVGDFVRITRQGDKGVLEALLPRKNAFIRPAVANIDQLVVLASCAIPVTEPFLIDRVLAIAGQQGVEPLICVNKNDLEPGEGLAGIYRRAGFRVVVTSAETGEGIDELRAAISGKLSAFTGNSGVGKSSILNALDPNMSLKTGEVSQALGRGRHTTRHVELYTLSGGAEIIDTPGFSSFDTDELGLALKERLPDAQMDPCESMDVRRAFQTLPEEDRMIVSLSVLGGYSSGEIGALLHRNANTVRSRLSRSMRRMQVLLEG